MRKAIKAWLRARFMHAVIVPEYRGLHWAWTLDGAMDWVRQYPAGCGVMVLARNDQELVGRR